MNIWANHQQHLNLERRDKKRKSVNRVLVTGRYFGIESKKNILPSKLMSIEKQHLTVFMNDTGIVFRKMYFYSTVFFRGGQT